MYGIDETNSTTGEQVAIKIKTLHLIGKQMIMKAFGENPTWGSVKCC